MFPNPYQIAGQSTYPLGYNPWTAHAQAQFRAAQLQAAAYNAQPTLIQQSQVSVATSQSHHQQQAVALQSSSSLSLQQNNHFNSDSNSSSHGNHGNLGNHGNHGNSQQSPHHHREHSRSHYGSRRGGYHRRGRGGKRGYRHNGGGNDRRQKNPDFPRTCDICDMQLNGQQQWDMHVTGKKHLKQVRALEVQKLNILNSAHGLNLKLYDF